MTVAEIALYLNVLAEIAAADAEEPEIEAMLAAQAAADQA